MRQLVSDAHVQIDTNKRDDSVAKNWKKLKKIKIVEDEKDGKQNIDNHSGQNYNVEHFCICTHE